MKKLSYLIITMVFLGIPSFCAAIDFQPLQPEMAERLRALKEEVKAQGGTYEVSYSAAMDKSMVSLAGLKIPAGWKKSDAPSVPMLGSSTQTLPSSWDWREKDGVTPIKNQGNCGSCWAFGTVGPLESQILIKDHVTVDLSEQYLVSCNVYGWSCGGGWWAHDYHMDLDGQDKNSPGAVLNASDPYTASSSKCIGQYKHPYKVTNWAYVGSQSAVPSVEAIKHAIYTYGPISAAVYVGPKFQAYGGGIFNTNETGEINHAIVLVGWNDDLGKDNGYWILRNSWGVSWGEKGYMRIRYGVSQVGYSANFIEFGGGTGKSNPVIDLPNLTGAFVNVRTSEAGEVLSGSLWVENEGNATTTTTFRTLLYLSNDGVSKSSLLGWADIPVEIPPRYYVDIEFSEGFSTSVIGKYLIAVIDPDHVVPDSNRNNSVVVSRITQSKQ
jgi:C1A family cysteine protease